MNNKYLVIIIFLLTSTIIFLLISCKNNEGLGKIIPFPIEIQDPIGYIEDGIIFEEESDIKLPKNADPETFKVFKAEARIGGPFVEVECLREVNCPYTADINNVYYKGNVIKDADPETFVLIGYGLLYNKGKEASPLQPQYAIDKNNVYYSGEVVTSADPETFTPVFSGGYYYEYGKDLKNVYWKSKIIKNANPETFRVFEGHQVYEGCNIGSYSLDDKNVYYEEKLVKGADPKTFKPVLGSGYYGEDANNFFHNENIESRDKYEECNYG